MCPPGGCACLYVYATDSCDCERLGAEPNGWGSGLSLGNKIYVSLSDLPRRPVARSSIGCSPGRSWWTLADSGYVIGPVALGLVTDAFGIEAALANRRRAADRDRRVVRVARARELRRRALAVVMASTSPPETFSVVASTPELVVELEAIQRAAFPTLAEDELITAAHYRAHIERFPAGQLAVLTGVARST